MTAPPARGKRGRDRHIAEAAAAAKAAGAKQGPRDAGRGAGRRLPDLSALPPLLAGDRLLRQRSASASGRRADTPGLTSVPHGAKTYLAAALALVDGGERLAWIARDAEIGDRVAEELAGVARRPGRGRDPRAADGARLRAERARRRRDGRARRCPVGLAEWPRADPRRERPGARPAHDRSGRPPGDAARARRQRPPPPGRAAPRPSRPRLCARRRGRRPRRVRPPRRHRRRLPAVGAAAGPDRVLRRRDRLAAGLRPDRPAGRRARWSA